MHHLEVYEPLGGEQRLGMPPEEQRKTLLVYLKTYPFVALRKKNQ
jgi:hypothetical protein